ncbi:MAG: DUF5985 family protein [Sphingomonas bacterium]
MASFFPTSVYVLCFATSSLCALLLARSYRRSSARLLLWSSLSFALLAANNLLVTVDMILLPAVDLRMVRYALSLAAVSLLLFGFIWDLED